MSNIIKARRGTEQKEFSQAAWGLLPADKYGWHEEVDVPDEIKALQAPVSNAPDPAADIADEKPNWEPVDTDAEPETEKPAQAAAPSETVSTPAKTGRKGAGK